MNLYGRIAVNAVINLLNIGVNILVGLALTPYFIHTLGEATYGVWIFAVSLSVVRGFLGNFDFGIQTSVIKYVAEYDALNKHRLINEVVSAALICYLGIGIVLSVGIGVLVGFRMEVVVSVFHIPATHIVLARGLLLFLAGQTLFDFLAMPAMGLLEGLQRYDVTRGLNILRLVVFAGCSIGLMLIGMGVYALAVATLMGEVVRLTGHIICIRRFLPEFRLTNRVTAAVWRQIFFLSGKTFAFNILYALYGYMDVAIISIVLTTTLLTDYDISGRLHTFVFALTTILSPFVVPAASVFHARGDREGMRLLLIRATKYSAAMTLPVGMIMIVLAKPLTMVWVGSEYAHTVSATQLFISYLLFWVLVRIGQNMLFAINRAEITLPIWVLNIALHFVVSTIAAPREGVFGVLLGMVAGNALACLLYLFAFQHEFGMTVRHWWQDIIGRVYWQAAGGALISATLAHWYPPVSLIGVGLHGLAGLMVFGVLFLLTGVPPNELAWFRTQASSLVQTLGWSSRE